MKLGIYQTWTPDFSPHFFHIIFLKNSIVRFFFSCFCRATSCFGATSGKQDRIVHSQQQCAHAIFTSPAVNLAPYELNFQLLVRGACLLAGTACLLK